MKPPKQSLAGAMLFVAFLALDFAVARAVFRTNPELVVGAAITCLALQAAALAFWRSRGRARAFWLGFLAFGCLGTMSYIRAMHLPQMLTVSQGGARVITSAPALKPYPRLGPRNSGTVKITAISPLGWPLRDRWLAYGRIVGDRLAPMLFDLDNPPPIFDPGAVVYRAIVWSVPQLLCAFLGGLAAWAVYGRMSRGKLTEPAPSGSGGEDVQVDRAAGYWLGE